MRFRSALALFGLILALSALPGCRGRLLGGDDPAYCQPVYCQPVQCQPCVPTQPVVVRQQ